MNKTIIDSTNKAQASAVGKQDKNQDQLHCGKWHLEQH
jgi:hypothetical protein